MLWFSIKALFVRPRPGADFDKIKTAAFTIESHHSHLRVSTDGEIAMLATPLHYRIRPRDLRVAVPRPAP